LIEWNRTLFDVVVPHAWAAALQALARLRPIADIFTFWPGPQPPTITGDLSYWARVPLEVAKASVHLPVWPLHRDIGESSMEGRHVILNDVLVADVDARDVPRELCDALAAAGVRLTRVPRYVHVMIKSLAVGRLLSPSAVWSDLVVGDL
jgi:hypothetical protein